MIRLLEKKVSSRGKYHFIFSNDESWSSSQYVYYRFHQKLQEENELTEAEYLEIKEEAEREQVKHKAYQLISRKNHTEKELREKLKKQRFSDQSIESIMETLKEQNYIKDRQYLSEWALNKAKNSYWGPYKLRQKLKERTDKRQLIETIINEVYEKLDETELMKKLLDKKKKNGPYEDKKEKAKAYRLLTANGFTSETIQGTIF